MKNKEETLLKLKLIRRKLSKIEPDYDDCVYDEEKAHKEADAVLLDLIDNEAITNAYNDIDKWYA